MSEPRSRVLYISHAADRFFLVPPGDGLRPGNLLVVSVTGEEHRLDAAWLASLEVTRANALEHLRADVQRAVSTVAEEIGLAGAHSEGTAAAGVLANDMRALSAAIVSGGVAGLTAARERLAARGLNPGTLLDALAHDIRALRQPDPEQAGQTVPKDPHAVADAVEGGHEPLGPRVDALLTLLELELGPLVGVDRQAEAAAREDGYRRSATSAIGDALREAGITPLTD